MPSSGKTGRCTLSQTVPPPSGSSLGERRISSIYPPLGFTFALSLRQHGKVQDIKFSPDATADRPLRTISKVGALQAIRTLRPGAQHLRQNLIVGRPLPGGLRA